MLQVILLCAAFYSYWLTATQDQLIMASTVVPQF